MQNSISSLGARLTAEITENLANYLDKIEFQSIAEIDFIARKIFETFDGLTHLDKLEFETKIASLVMIENIHPKTQVSLSDQLESVGEIYRDAQLYVGVPDKNAEDGIRDDPMRSRSLRELIIKKVRQTASELLSLTIDQKFKFIERFQEQSCQNRQTQSLFEKRVADLRTKALFKNSTLTELQQFHRHSVEMEIDFHDLQSLRNPDVDLHEDTPLMEKLIELDFCFFPKHYELLKLNPSLLNLAATAFVQAIRDDDANISYMHHAVVFPNFRAIAIEVVKIHHQFIQMLYYLNAEMKNDRELALSAVKSNHRAFHYLHANLRNDRDIILEVTSQNGLKILTLKTEFQQDREIAAAAIQEQHVVFRFLSDDLRNERNLAQLAVKNCGENLQFVGSTLQNDKELTLSALGNTSSAAQFIGQHLKGDRQIAQAAVTSSGLNLQYLSPEIKRDRILVLSAVKQDADALKFADISLMGDLEIISQAVRSKGELLRLANPDLCRDKNVIKLAMNSSVGAYYYAGDKLKGDVEFISFMLSKLKSFIDDFPADLIGDVELIISSNLDLETHGISHEKLTCRNKNLISALTNLSLSFSQNTIELVKYREKALSEIKLDNFDTVLEIDLLKSDRDVVLAMVKRDGRQLQMVDPNLRNDIEIVRTALQSIPNLQAIVNKIDPEISKNDLASTIFLFAGEKLKKDLAFAKEIVDEFGPNLLCFDLDLMSNREFVLAAVKKNPDSFQFASSKLRADREIALAALDGAFCGINIEFVGQELLNDRELIERAVKNRGSSTFASEELHSDYAFMQSLNE